MIFEWDVQKAEINFKKHAVRFSETLAVLKTITRLRSRTTSLILESSVFCRLEPAGGHESL